MTLYKTPTSNPPKESGAYLIGNSNGHTWQAFYESRLRIWTTLNGGEIKDPFEFWYSPEPPADLAEVLNILKEQITRPVNKYGVVITPQMAKTLLTHLTKYIYGTIQNS